MRPACRAAGIDFASSEEDKARRGDLVQQQPVNGEFRGGGSSWQSLARGTGSIEADYLNGEITMLGRIHGVPTPVNALMQRVANEQARAGAPPQIGSGRYPARTVGLIDGTGQGSLGKYQECTLQPSERR